MESILITVFVFFYSLYFSSTINYTEQTCSPLRVTLFLLQRSLSLEACYNYAFYITSYS